MNKKKYISKKLNLKSSSNLTSNSLPLSVNYELELDQDTKYSLNVDPTNKYNFTNKEVEFIILYSEERNLVRVSELMNLNIIDTNKFYKDYRIRNELRRISMAKYHRIFSDKMLSLDKIGAYLSNLIYDFNLAESEKLSPQDKLKVVELLMKCQTLINESTKNPTIITTNTVEMQLKNLSIKTISSMLDNLNHQNNSGKQVSFNNNNNNNLIEVSPDNTEINQELIRNMDTNKILTLLEENQNYDENEEKITKDEKIIEEFNEKIKSK